MADSNVYLKEIVRAHNLVGFEDVFWNLGQVFAWAETRNPFPVDALSDSTPELARRDHSFAPGLPHFATEIAAENCEENGVAKTKSPFRSLDDVRIAILRSFQSGEMSASGQRRGSSARESITPLEWADLTINENAREEMTVRLRDGYVVVWNNVRVRRQDVLSVFPVLQSSAPKEGESDRVLSHRDTMEDMLDELPPSTRQEVQMRRKRQPAEELFDPDKLSHWSITMTIAWIIWGDIGAVREEWDDYRSQCAEWRFFPELAVDTKVLEGAIRNASLDEPAPNDPEISVFRETGGSWRFSAWAPSGWLGLEFKARGNEIPWEDTVDALWLAAGEGKILATALECPVNAAESTIVELPQHLWPRLRRKRESSGKALLSGPDRDYRDVRFSRLDVKGLWPLKQVTPVAQDDAPSTEKPATKRRTNNARGRPKEYKWDTEIKEFALGLVRRHGVPGEGNPKLSRQEDLVLAIQNELAKKDLHPGASSVRRYVSRWLADL